MSSIWIFGEKIAEVDSLGIFYMGLWPTQLVEKIGDKKAQIVFNNVFTLALAWRDCHDQGHERDV